jgi:quinol monooxygenase YgiN
VKGALKQSLIPTLQDAGCEGMFERSREGDPHKLVFFEIFSSSAAHKFHLEQDYMKRLFKALEGKLAGASIMTKLNALWRHREVFRSSLRRIESGALCAWCLAAPRLSRSPTMKL